MADTPVTEGAGAAPNQNEAAELRAALDVERRRAEAAEARANDSGRRLVQSETGRLVAQEQTVDQAIVALGNEISSYEGEIADLQAEGKFPEAAAVIRKMSTASAKLAQNEALKQQIAGVREQASRVSADPLDVFFANAERSGRPFSDSEKSWIRQNPRYASDQSFNALVNRAHDEATRDHNLARGTVEYFRYLEDRAYGRSQTQQTQQPQVAATGGAAQPQAQSTPEPADTEIDPSPYSDTGETDGGEPEIIIAAEEPQVAQPEPNARPRQAKAAGPGSMASVAAMPTRRTPGVGLSQRQTTRLTPEQADTALRLARDLAPAEVLAKGDTEVYKWYATLRDLPSVVKRREVA